MRSYVQTVSFPPREGPRHGTAVERKAKICSESTLGRNFPEFEDRTLMVLADRSSGSDYVVSNVDSFGLA